MEIVPTTREKYDGFKKILSGLYNNIKFRELVSVHCKEWECDKVEYAKSPHVRPSSQEMINSKAIRTYIFDGDKTDHFGHFDIRPFKSKNLDGVVCDAFLPDPHKLKNNQDKIFITCKKSYRADDFGYSVINTVPYMMPDIILSHCSHATLWIIFRLLSYELGKEYLSLVNLANDLYADDGGAVATNNVPILCEKYGYNYALYDGKLKKAHYKDVDETLLKIKNKKCVSEDEFDRLEQVVYEHKSVFSSPKSVLLTSESLYAYVESEIPVYLVFDSYDLKSEYGFDGDEGSHSIVAIGHTMNKNGELADFIAHDVSFASFVCISKEFVDEKLIDSIVILPSDINVRYERAKTRVKRILQFYEANLLHDSNKSRSKEEIMEELKEAKIDKYFFRPFLMKSQRTKFWYTKKCYLDYFNDMIAKADFPKYTWTFEIKTEGISNDTCMGHIIIDATSSFESDNKSVVLINMPDYKMYYKNGELVNVPDEGENTFPLFRAA